MANGPTAGLEQIDALDGLDGYHLFHAARADMLRRLGRLTDAEAGYRAALRLAENGAERLYLERRIRECCASGLGVTRCPTGAVSRSRRGSRASVFCAQHTEGRRVEHQQPAVGRWQPEPAGGEHP